jgi:hypothetical protein
MESVANHITAMSLLVVSPPFRNHALLGSLIACHRVIRPCSCHLHRAAQVWPLELRHRLQHRPRRHVVRAMLECDKHQESRLVLCNYIIEYHQVSSDANTLLEKLVRRFQYRLNMWRYCVPVVMLAIRVRRSDDWSDMLCFQPQPDRA